MDIENIILELNKFDKAGNAYQFDLLTKTYNRNYFTQKFYEATLTSLKDNKTFSVILTDIDGLKIINDTYGHDIGDIAIKGIANIIKSYVHSPNIVARYGGDEFILLLPGYDNNLALNLAEKLRRAVNNHYIEEIDKSNPMSIGIGISTFSKNDVDVHSIIRRVDEALGQAKNEGRNSIYNINRQ
jgi:diguanylate cyclase (GGDEF)-like protein